MSGQHTFRLHLLCAASDVDGVNATFAKRIPGEVELVQSDKHPDLWLASGQWTPAQAAQITAACAGLPVRVVRGVALGLVEAGAVVVNKGPAPRNEAQARRTVERAIEDWKAEQASQPLP